MTAAPTPPRAYLVCLSLLALTGCASLPSPGGTSVASLMPTLPALPADPVGSVLGSLGSLFGGPRVELDKLVQAQKWDEVQKLYLAHQKALDSAPEARASLGQWAAHLQAQAAPAQQTLITQLRPSPDRPLSPAVYADVLRLRQQARDEIQRIDQHPLLAQAAWRPPARAELEAALAASEQALRQSLPDQFIAFPHKGDAEFFQAYPLLLKTDEAQALLRARPELLRQALQRGDAAQADLLMQRYAATHDDPAQRDTLILAWWSAQERTHGKKPSTLRQRIAVQQRLAAWLPGYEAKPRIGLLPLAASSLSSQHQTALAQRTESLRARFDARLLSAGTVSALEQALQKPEANELDLLIVSIDSAPSVTHAKTDTGTQPGRYLAGQQSQNNPKYYELQQSLMRARQQLRESQRARQQAMQQARSMGNASNGLAALSALTVTAGAFAESSSQIDVNNLERELAGTPQTLRVDVHQNYDRSTVTYSQVTVVPSQLYVIDPASQRVTAFQGQQTRQGQIVQVQSCHPGDRDCRAATPQDLQQWLQTQVQQTLSEAPAQPASIEALLAALESPEGRPVSALRDWIQEGSEGAQRVAAQHQSELEGRALREPGQASASAPRAIDVLLNRPGASGGGGARCDGDMRALADRIPAYTDPTLRGLRTELLDASVPDLLQKARATGTNAAQLMAQAAEAERGARDAANTAQQTDAGQNSIQQAARGTLPLNWVCTGIHASAVCAHLSFQWQALFLKEAASRVTSCA